MQNNFIRVAAANIDVKLLNVEENKKSIIQYLDFACKNSIDVLTFPELCLTGVSAGEMTVSDEIICRCEKALEEIIEYTQDKKILFSLGLPIKINGMCAS